MEIANVGACAQKLGRDIKSARVRIELHKREVEDSRFQRLLPRLAICNTLDALKQTKRLLAKFVHF